MSSGPPPAALPRRRLFLYGLSDMPIQVAMIPVLSLVPNLYGSDMGIPVAVVGTMMLLARSFDIVTDPLIGWCTDHTRTRWGRRRVWMLAAIPFLTLASYKLFVPPDGVDAYYLLLWLVVFWLGWTMLQIPYYALGAELSPSYDERTRITAWRSWIGIAANVVSKVVPVIAGLCTAYFCFDMGGVRNNLLIIGMMMVVLVPLTIGTTVLGVPEPKSFVPARTPLLPGLAIMWNNRPFRRLVLALFINFLGQSISTVTVVFFIRDVLQEENLAILMLLVFFGFNLAGIPFWNWFAHRINKHRAWCIALFAFAGLHCVYMLLGPGDFYYMLPITACTGFLGAAFPVVPPSMTADIVDLDTLETGEDRTAMYFAVSSFMVKIGSAFGPFMALALLGLTGYDAQAGAGGSVDGLRMLYSFGPAAGFAICALIVWNYPLTRERHQALRASLLDKPVAGESLA